MSSLSGEKRMDKTQDDTRKKLQDMNPIVDTAKSTSTQCKHTTS